MVINTLNKYYTQVFSAVRYKSKRRGHLQPSFTKNQLIKWLIENGVERLWIEYMESGMDKWKKPSVDRIDDYIGYSFDNMQLVTWRENHQRNFRSVKNYNNCSPLVKPITLYKNGQAFHFESQAKAAKALNVHPLSICRVFIGTRKSIKKYTLTKN